MSESGFIDWLVKTMLGWARWITDLMWDSINSGPRENGALAWFGSHWMIIAAVMIIAGIVIDWLVWMVRWRPYWLWFRKKQIIYAEEGEMTLSEQQAALGEARKARKNQPDVDVFAPKKKAVRTGDGFEEDPFADDTPIAEPEEPKEAPRKAAAKEGYHIMFDDGEKSKRHVMFEDEDFDDPFSEQDKA